LNARCLACCVVSQIEANATALHFQYHHNSDDALADEFFLWR
jgi:hypothetical protein